MHMRSCRKPAYGAALGGGAGGPEALRLGSHQQRPAEGAARADSALQYILLQELTGARQQVSNWSAAPLAAGAATEHRQLGRPTLPSQPSLLPHCCRSWLRPSSLHRHRQRRCGCTDPPFAGDPSPPYARSSVLSCWSTGPGALQPQQARRSALWPPMSLLRRGASERQASRLPALLQHASNCMHAALRGPQRPPPKRPAAAARAAACSAAQPLAPCRPPT